MGEPTEGDWMDKEDHSGSTPDDNREKHPDYINSKYWWKEFKEGRITADQLEEHLGVIDERAKSKGLTDMWGKNGA